MSPFDLEGVGMDAGKLLDADAIGALESCQRHAVIENGISSWAVPGTPGGMNFVTGNERDAWGQVTTEPVNRKAMMDKWARRIDAIHDRLPRAVEWGDRESSIGLIEVGMEAGVMTEAAERLRESGISLRRHRPRTLWPVLEDTRAFAAACLRVYVIKHNEGGQLQHLLAGAGAPAEAGRGIRKCNGSPFRRGEHPAFEANQVAHHLCPAALDGYHPKRYVEAFAGLMARYSV